MKPTREPIILEVEEDVELTEEEIKKHLASTNSFYLVCRNIDELIGNIKDATETMQ